MKSIQMKKISNIAATLSVFLILSCNDKNPYEYRTVKIGDQVWMAENMRVTHYRNGDPIPHVTNDNEWEFLTTGAYCNYDNDEKNVATFGRLYNWYAVNDSRNLAPVGWHIPSDEEWKKMEIFLGMKHSESDSLDWRGTNQGGKLKKSDSTIWKSPNKGATNESRFSVLPGGYRYLTGDFSQMGQAAYYWTSSANYVSHALYRLLDWRHSEINRGDGDKVSGFSVRCIKDYNNETDNGNVNRKVGQEIKRVKGVDRYGKPYLLIQVDLYPGSGLDVEERTRVLNFETGEFIDNDIYIAIEDDDIVKATPKKGFFIARRGSGGTFGAMGAIIQEYILDSEGKEGMMTETKYWLMDNFSFSEPVADFFDISNPSVFGILAPIFIFAVIIRFGRKRIREGSKVTKNAK